jgi:hypothetical protein
MTPLAVCQVQALAADAATPRWLIEGLWADQAMGIVGGEPKSGKSLLALDLTVAVASGAPCLRRFRPVQTGPPGTPTGAPPKPRSRTPSPLRLLP